MSAFANRIEADIRREAKRRRALFTVHYTPEVAEALDEFNADMEHAVFKALTSIEKVPLYDSMSFTGTVPSWRDKSDEAILTDLEMSAALIKAAEMPPAPFGGPALLPIHSDDYVVREDERGTIIYHKGSISHTDGL